MKILKSIGFLFLIGFFVLSLGCSTHNFMGLEHSTPPTNLTTTGIYREEGLASWYGPGFYGHKTASGEKLNKKDLTCAHRTLPLGTLLRVTNLENDRAVEVRVNDRGPYVRNKIVDLSYAAAKQIGMFPGGEVRVSLQSLVTQDNPPEVSITDLIQGVEKK